MSARTPGLQQRSQYHSYWGQYQYDTAGSPPPPYSGRAADAGSQSLPNAPNNPLTNPEFSKLEAGDIAATIDTTAPIDGNEFGLWMCVYPGTLSGGNAVWVRLDNQAVNIEQTVRDAHVIVVGQNGYLGPLAGVASPPLASNGLNLGGVGDQVDVTCDYLDPGNGTQLEQALLAAAAGGVQVDVRLRACNIVLDPASLTAVPLVLPQYCSLIGAGSRASVLRGGDGALGSSQAILDTGIGCLISDIAFVSPDPVASPASDTFLVNIKRECEVRSCYFELQYQSNIDRATGACLGSDSNNMTGTKVHDCTFVLPSAEQNGLPFIAVAFARATWMTGCPTVENIHVTGGQIAVRTFNLETIQVRGVVHRLAWRPQTISTIINTSNWSDTRQFMGPHVSDVHLSLDPNGGLSDSLNFSQLRCVDVVVQNNNTAPSSAVSWVGCKFSNITIDWGDSQVITQPVVGVSLVAGGAGNSRITGGNVSDVTVTGLYTTGVDISAETNGLITAVRVNGVQAPFPQTIGTNTPIAYRLDVDGGLISRVGLMNCMTAVVGATSVGVLVNSGVYDTILVGNHFIATVGATAIQDLGIGTEAAHNILS